MLVYYGGIVFVCQEGKGWLKAGRFIPTEAFWGCRLTLKYPLPHTKIPTVPQRTVEGERRFGGCAEKLRRGGVWL